MRISSSLMFSLGINSIEKLQSSMMNTQQQLSSGNRILTPADDPVAAARVLDVSQSLSANGQYGTNTNSASSALNLEDSVLASVSQTIQNIQTQVVNAGNGSLTDADRQSLAANVTGQLQQLLGLANTRDGSGQYLFSGYKGTTQPFVETATGAQYSGDQGQRLVQIDSSRQIPVSDSGHDVFERVKTGNGVFVTAAASANTGTGIVSQGTVVDQSKWNAPGNSKNYSVVFAVDNTGSVPVTTYDIVDNSTGKSMITGNPSAAAASATGGPEFPRTYTSGNAIQFKQLATDPGPLPPAWDLGVSLTVSGAPAGSPPVGVSPPPGADTFTVQASTNQSLFTTIKQVIGALQMPQSNATDTAAFNNNVNTAINNLSNALDNVLTVRGGLGARLNEVDSVQTNGQTLNQNYTQQLSNLQDVDYAKAISDLSSQQMQLQAAQKSYLQVTGLSLFNYITP